MKYKIVADSSANIYERDSIDYTSVPLKIVTADREYCDVRGMDLAGMISYLQRYRGKSGTTCPNVTDWLDAFGDADIILGVTITSGLSGSYATAMQAKTEYEAAHPNAKVLIVDSLSAGPELALIIEKMEEVLKSGQTFEDMTKTIKDYCKHSHLLFGLRHLNNLARNGRVNPTAVKIASLLGMRIIGKASEEGTLQLLHKFRNETKALNCIWEEMKKHGYHGGKVRLAHCFNPQIAQALSDIIHQSYPDADIRITLCTGLCSFYAEQGGLMIGYEGE